MDRRETEGPSEKDRVFVDRLPRSDARGTRKVHFGGRLSTAKKERKPREGRGYSVHSLVSRQGGA